MTSVEVVACKDEDKGERMVLPQASFSLLLLFHQTISPSSIAYPLSLIFSLVPFPFIFRYMLVVLRVIISHSILNWLSINWLNILQQDQKRGIKKSSIFNHAVHVLSLPAAATPAFVLPLPLLFSISICLSACLFLTPTVFCSLSLYPSISAYMSVHYPFARWDSSFNQISIPPKKIRKIESFHTHSAHISHPVSEAATKQVAYLYLPAFMHVFINPYHLPFPPSRSVLFSLFWLWWDFISNLFCCSF